MEFACAVAGAKLVVVMGHTACGAVKGAIDDVELGNLTGLLAKISPAIGGDRL
jgi:carbonic anhydrase